MNLTKDDLKRLINDIDVRIGSIKGWIKHYYSVLKVDPMRTVDMQSHELDKHLDEYYHLRKQRDFFISKYDEEE